MIKGGRPRTSPSAHRTTSSESFRNELWPGYKTGEGIEADLLAQFPLLGRYTFRRLA